MTKAQQNPAQLPQPPQPAAPGTPAPAPIYRTSEISGPEAVLNAARASRDELQNQLERLEERRRELVEQMQRAPDGEAREGIARRISTIDQRIVEVEKQVGAAEEAVARAAAIPGAVVERPEPPEPPDPDAMAESIAIIGGMLTIFVLFPLTLAYARRLWRRGAVAVAELPKVLAERLTRIDQAVDAIAIEVERISEGQRFLTKVMSDGNRAVGAGPAEPVEVRAREEVPVPRSPSR